MNVYFNIVPLGACRLVCVRLFALILLCVGAGGLAQAAPGDAFQPQRDIRQNQETQQRERLQRELENDFRQLAPPEAPLPAVDAAGPCFVVHTFRFLGVDALDVEAVSAVQQLAQGVAGRCLTLNELFDLVSQINRYFQDQGLVTTRAFLPEQSLAEGELTIRIIVGKVQSLASETLSERNLRWAFPVAEGDTLNLRDIEQGLDQINRLPSNRATLRMLPGEAPGDTVLNVDNERGKALNARAVVDGTSIQQGDDYRGRLDLFADDPLGLNDQLILNGNQSLAERRRLQSDGYGFDYSVPWHYQLFSLGASRYDYDNVVNGANRDFNVSGSNTAWTLAANHTAYRDRSIKFDLLASLTTRDIKNFIEDSRIDVSSRRLTVARVEAKYKQFVWRDLTWFANFGVDTGLDALGADDDGSMQRPDEAQFVKMFVGTRVAKPFDFDRFGVWSTVLSAQWQQSNDVLVSAEQILVAGSSQLRAFGPLYLTGSTGGWVRADLETPYFLRSDSSGVAMNSRLSLLRGHVPHDHGPLFAYGSATAVEWAVMAVGHGVSLELALGKPLDTSGTVANTADDIEVGLSLAYDTF